MKKLLCFLVAMLFLIPAMNGIYGMNADKEERNEIANPFIVSESIPIKNHAPTALINASDGIVGKAIIFDASLSYDPDNDALQYRWDFDNDGVYDTPWMTSPQAMHVYHTPYNEFVRLEVKDEHGATDECIARVVIKNASPATITGDVDQKQEQADGYVKIYGDKCYAQTFKPSKLKLTGIDIYVGRKGIASYESNKFISFLSERIRNMLLKFFGISFPNFIESMFLGDLVVNVWEVKDNKIQGIYITGHTFKADEISRAGNWIHADFSGIKLEPYKTYAIVVYQTGGSERNYYKWYYGNGDLYENGMFYERTNGAWNGDIGRDFCFRTYGELSGDEPDGVEEKWAVLIGVLETSDGTICHFADNDAYDARDCLIAHGWNPSHIKVLISPTKNEIKSALSWMAKNDDYDDIDLVMWSAHGSMAAPPYGYLFVTYDGIFFGKEIDSCLDKCSYKGMLVIAETCQSGGVIHDVAQDGRVILTSSREDRPSWLYGAKHNSVFIYFLFDSREGAFSMRSCDYNKDGYVSAEEAYKYASKATDDWLWWGTHNESGLQYPQMSDRYPTQQTIHQNCS